MKEYRTIKQNATSEFVEKKSRFIGSICPVSTETEALAFLRTIKSTHWSATHNVSAFVLLQGQLKRYSDDGEPRGTAGVPALEVLEKEHLHDCAVVVTRYFGGTLLGSGGLVRAYSHACKLAVDAAGIVTMSACITGCLLCNYAYYETFLKLCSRYSAVVESNDFSEQVTMHFYIKEENFTSFNDAVIDSSFGKYRLQQLGERYAQTNTSSPN